MIKKILNPDLYHARHRNNNFFEGWYFKIVSPSGDVIAFIPGIITSKEVDSFSFIQIFNGSIPKLDFMKFPIDSFLSPKRKFSININKNQFSLEGINMDIKDDKIDIKVDLHFFDIQKWPDSIINPGSMGFYNYLPFMECYSQVCAMNGSVKGHVKYNNHILNFDGGSLYVEKNWGTGFPYSYIWCQCNSFTDKNLSLSCSIGKIPMFSKSFTGFLIGLHTNRGFYKFTTINKSILKIISKSNSINLLVENHDHRLRINCYYKQDKFVKLYAPKESDMMPCTQETLIGNISIALEEKITDRILIEDTSNIAGIEFSGSIQDLQNELRS